jgi:hypothetical protein
VSGGQQTLTLDSGIRATAIENMTGGPDLIRAVWPKDEHGDRFSIAFVGTRFLLGDVPVLEHVLTSMKEEYELCPGALWCNWDGAWA